MTAPSLPAVGASLRGAKVAVLGAGGVIGSRVAEVLAGEIGADVTAVVRTLSKAVRLARYPVRLLSGDVRDPALLDRALAGCSAAIDLTYPKDGDRREKCWDARQMAGAISDAVLRNRVRRLVHLSTISVYGPLAGDMLDESAPRRPGADPYGASKLAGELEMLRQARERRVPVAVLQPTVVYGPFAGWTLGPLNQLRNGTVVLPDGGHGVCNAVHLDDVVQAILRAAVAPGIEGEAFLVSGELAPTWREFYGAYEAMLGFTSTQAVDAAAIRAFHVAQAKAARPMRRILHVVRQDGALRQAILGLPGLAQIYAAAQFILPQGQMARVKDQLMNRTPTSATAPPKPLLYPSAAQLGIMATSARVSLDKARRLLGFVPAYDFEAGMRATREWAEWARLL